MNPKRHPRDCQICKHPAREEIKTAFVEWRPTTRIARDFQLGSRQSLARHVRACGLISKRSANVAAVLASIVERGLRPRVSSRTAVIAIATLAKINSRGRWIDRHEVLDVNQLFDRMSHEEMLAYAQTGELPQWFEESIGGRPVAQEDILQYLILTDTGTKKKLPYPSSLCCAPIRRVSRH
jgi:hypothetical protein